MLRCSNTIFLWKDLYYMSLIVLVGKSSRNRITSNIGYLFNIRYFFKIKIMLRCSVK